MEQGFALPRGGPEGAGTPPSDTVKPDGGGGEQLRERLQRGGGDGVCSSCSGALSQKRHFAGLNRSRWKGRNNVSCLLALSVL